MKLIYFDSNGRKTGKLVKSLEQRSKQKQKLETWKNAKLKKQKSHVKMFPSSTQRKHWMLGSEDKVIKQRLKAYDDFIDRFGNNRSLKFLSFEESEFILKFFERKLADFLNKFRPPMPKNVFGTALQYFKRFYLSNSVMDYHPKEILVTAAYLATKSEEFNVTMDQVCFYIF